MGHKYYLGGKTKKLKKIYNGTQIFFGGGQKYYFGRTNL